MITGCNGQLAKEFKFLFTKDGVNYVAPGKDQLDILNRAQVEKFLVDEKPDIVLNCAAYNLVDKAEDEKDLAFRINAEAVGNLAALCKKYNIFLVHYSSDYVFDGAKKGLYTEEDAANPLNAYGMSKLQGEQSVQKQLTNYLILRLSWLFGKGKQNFLYKFYQWTREKEVIEISADEVSVPTYTEDVVDITLLALENGLTGLYHLTNSGYASRYELAKYFIEKMNLNNLLIPVPMSTFNAKAKRPCFSVMSNAKISKTLDVSIPRWEYGVDRIIEIVKEGLV